MKFNRIIYLLSFLMIVFLYPQEPILIFSSGYEGSSEVMQFNVNGNQNENYADIIGEDGDYNWIEDLDENENIGDYRIYYENGDTSKAIAEIIEEPGNESNHVLRFLISQPHIDYTNNAGDSLQKGRIQASIKNSIDLHQFYYKQRLFIPTEFDTLKSDPREINWLTLQEIWNNESFQEFPFRVTFNIHKESGIGSELFFGAHGQSKITENGNSQWVSIWETVNEDFPVPTGEWIEVETQFIEGDALTGIFKIIITSNSGATHNVIDISNYTHHPEDDEPDGVTSFNPSKLYTSGELINGLNSVGYPLYIYWDDFKIWKYYLGDVNNDGLINVVDIVMLVNLILNGEFQQSGDLNQDGLLNVIDVVQLVNEILT